MSSIRNVVLVHGAFVDGSGWQQVYDLLVADGFRVAVTQHPTQSLGEDVATTRRAIESLDGPVVLVGHSYGGVVITEAGTHDQVAALVYVAALPPDAGESANTLIADPPPDAPVLPILPPVDGFLSLDRTKFHYSFAADLPEAQAQFMADSQVPCGVAAFDGTVTRPAWRDRPSWFVIATDDRMIPPSTQRTLADRAGAKVTEVAASHSLYVSQARTTADVIKQAAQA